MLATNGKSTLALGGINQQDFKEIQLVAGSWPSQVGLQQRVPGKTIQQVLNGPVSAIYPFYMVYGRAYTLTDFGSLQIEEVEIPTITLPGLPPSNSNTFFDTFEGYIPEIVSRIWGGGFWFHSVGICETIIDGIIDPFLVYATIAPGREDPENRPIPMPDPEVDPEVPPAPPVVNPPLPDGHYTDYPISAGFENILRYPINGVSQFEEAPLPCNPATFSVGFTALTYGSPSTHTELKAVANSQSFKGCNNVAWSVFNYLISNNSGYRTQATLKLNELPINYRAQVFLIGTETLSDALGGPDIVTQVTDDITVYVNSEGATYNVQPPAGNTFLENPAPSFGYERITRHGTLEWTAIRVYDSAPL